MVGNFVPPKFITDAEMDDLRALMKSTMLETATIRRRNRVSDGAGGYIDSGDPDNPPAVAENVPVLRVSGVEGASVSHIAGGQDVYGLRWELWFPHDTDVRDDDQVEINGTEYEVIDTAIPATYNVGTLAYARKR